ncbi:MAG: S-layer homology domain-containing protein [Clostridia bacterium]|nr:S-layer homology domain-containing protein [Clostridia bacterium]
MLLLAYEEIDEQHFAVNTYMCDIDSLSIMSFPLAFNNESVEVCAYDAETGEFSDITDGVLTPTQAYGGKNGISFNDKLFNADAWGGELICNNFYPYISNEEGIIKLTMYSLNDKYSFAGQNELCKVYFKRISDQPAQIRIATKYNAENYDVASADGATFINMIDIIDVQYQYNGDVFDDSIVVVQPDEETENNSGVDGDTESTGSTSSSSSGSGTTGGNTSSEMSDEEVDTDIQDSTEDTDKTDDTSDNVSEEVPESKIFFTDVDESFWAYEPIYKLAEKKIINGYEDQTFKPNGNITRAELATIAVVAKELELLESEAVFSDSAVSAWYNRYLITAYKAGFISGYPDGSFKPDSYISREDLCVVLAKAFLADAAEDAGELSFA